MPTEMARKLYFYPDSNCYVVRWTGDLTLEALVEHWRELLRDPDYRPEDAALHDVRSRSIETAYSDTLAGRDVYKQDVAPKVGRGRVSVLVDNAAAFGTGRQLTMMTGLEEDSLVTYSEEEAKRWVGLPVDMVLPYDSSV